MSKHFKMVISPDGKALSSVYNDALDASALGKPTIQRATDVYYNNKKRHWVVRLLKPVFADDFVLAAGFKNRAEAIDYEVRFLNENMEKIIADKASRESWTPA